MPQKISDTQPPRGFKRMLLRAPIWCYRLGLGWLLGKRFLLLNHIGRHSGLTRQTVLEVVNYDKDTGPYFIASGFGRQSDWYRNLLKTPAVTIQVGNRRMNVMARPLTTRQSGEASEENYRTVGREAIPFVELRHVTN